MQREDCAPWRAPNRFGFYLLLPKLRQLAKG